MRRSWLSSALVIACVASSACVSRPVHPWPAPLYDCPTQEDDDWVLDQYVKDTVDRTGVRPIDIDERLTRLLWASTYCRVSAEHLAR